MIACKHILAYSNETDANPCPVCERNKLRAAATKLREKLAKATEECATKQRGNFELAQRLDAANRKFEGFEHDVRLARQQSSETNSKLLSPEFKEKFHNKQPGATTPAYKHKYADHLPSKDSSDIGATTPEVEKIAREIAEHLVTANLIHKEERPRVISLLKPYFAQAREPLVIAACELLAELVDGQNVPSLGAITRLRAALTTEEK